MATAMLGSELEKAFLEREPSTMDASGKSWAQVALEGHMIQVNSAIYQAAQSQPQYAGMGTTLVVAVFHDNRVTVGHIGDSRLYRMRGDDFRQITRDHSLLQDPEVQAEIHDHEVLPGDVYLFCSDGLNDMVDDEEIGMTLGALSANLELCSMQLIQMANDNGGRDNVSVILVKVKGEYPVSRGMLSRLLAWFK